MRDQPTQETIKRAKKNSSIEEAHFVIETNLQREFFRFDMGRLVEYEMTKSSGRPIKYKPEELEGENEFKWSVL